MRLNSAYDAACGKLSYRMRTEKEIWDCLKSAGYGKEEIRQAIDELKAYGYIDDAKYCEEYFKYAKRKSKADARILQELVQKGIPAELARNAIEDAKEQGECEFGDDRSVAMGLALKMAEAQTGEGKPADDKFFARVARRLSAKGFAAGVIYSVISQLRTKIKESYSEETDES